MDISSSLTSPHLHTVLHRVFISTGSAFRSDWRASRDLSVSFCLYIVMPTLCTSLYVDILPTCLHTYTHTYTRIGRSGISCAHRPLCTWPSYISYHSPWLVPSFLLFFFFFLLLLSLPSESGFLCIPLSPSWRRWSSAAPDFPFELSPGVGVVDLKAFSSDAPRRLIFGGWWAGLARLLSSIVRKTPPLHRMGLGSFCFIRHANWRAWSPSEESLGDDVVSLSRQVC